MLIYALPCPAQEPEPPERRSLSDRIQFSGSWETEWAVGLEHANAQKLESQFQPQITIELPRNIDWTTILRFRGDLFDNLEPGRPGQPEISPGTRRILIGNHTDVELREFYLATTWDSAYVVIGKQQVVWGKADGLKVLDVVNPQDYREFILDDWEDSRIPLWTLNAEVPVKDMTLQLLWIPDTTSHRVPQEDSLFFATAGLPDPPPLFHVRVQEPDRPDRFISDSDVGLRLTAFEKGWDISFNYLYHYDDMPVLRRRIGFSQYGPTVHVNPEYERSHLVGATFSNAFGSLTFRGEAAFSTDKYFPARGFAGRQGVCKTGQLSYVLGLDWVGIEETFLSFQLFQNWLTGDTRGLVRDRVESFASFLVRRDFLHDTLFFETMVLQGLDGAGGLVRPKISYEVRDDVKVWAGLDVFYGSKRGVLGQFDARDRFVAGIEWFF